MKPVLTIFIILVLEFVATAQSTETTLLRPRRAELQRQSPRTVLDCDEAESEGLSIVLCSGDNIRLQVTPGALLHLTLDAYLRTRGMKVGALTRALPLHSPIQGKLGSKYSDRETLVETEITGHGGGIKAPAWLSIEPRRLILNVGPTDYIVFATKEQRAVYLKPGVWELELDCTIKQIVTPDGATWTAAVNAESNVIKNSKFGLDSQTQPPQTMFDGVTSLPGGVVIYSITQLKDLWSFIIHRPDMTLPTGTDLYFHINNITATYISRPGPISAATTVKKFSVNY